MKKNIIIEVLAVIALTVFTIFIYAEIAETAKAEQAEAIAEQQKHIEYIDFLNSLDYTALTAYFETTGTTKTAEEMHILTQKLIEYNEQQIKNNDLKIAVNNHIISTLETEINILETMKATASASAEASESY